MKDKAYLVKMTKLSKKEKVKEEKVVVAYHSIMIV